jgi:hypothetical protein
MGLFRWSVTSQWPAGRAFSSRSTPLPRRLILPKGRRRGAGAGPAETPRWIGRGPCGGAGPERLAVAAPGLAERGLDHGHIVAFVLGALADRAIQFGHETLPTVAI